MLISSTRKHISMHYLNAICKWYPSLTEFSWVYSLLCRKKTKTGEVKTWILPFCFCDVIFYLISCLLNCCETFFLSFLFNVFSCVLDLPLDGWTPIIHHHLTRRLIKPSLRDDTFIAHTFLLFFVQVDENCGQPEKHLVKIRWGFRASPVYLLAFTSSPVITVPIVIRRSMVSRA